MELAASGEKQEIEQFVLFYVPYVVVRTRSTIDLSTLFFSYNATEWITLWTRAEKPRSRRTIKIGHLRKIKYCNLYRQ